MAWPYAFETERLVIRSPSLEDVANVNAAVHETWDELHRWMAWAVTKPTLDETRAVRERQMEAQRQGRDHSVLAFDRDSGRFVAAIGIHPVEGDDRAFFIGYWRRASFGGRGLVTEATRAVCAFAFSQLGAEKLLLRCRPDNLQSRAVAERCGFEMVSEEPDIDAPGKTWQVFRKLRSPS